MKEINELIKTVENLEYSSDAQPEDTSEQSYDIGIQEGLRMGEERVKALVLAAAYRIKANALEHEYS